MCDAVCDGVCARTLSNTQSVPASDGLTHAGNRRKHVQKEAEAKEEAGAVYAAVGTPRVRRRRRHHWLSQ